MGLTASPPARAHAPLHISLLSQLDPGRQAGARRVPRLGARARCRARPPRPHAAVRDRHERGVRRRGGGGPARGGAGAGGADGGLAQPGLDRSRGRGRRRHGPRPRRLPPLLWPAQRHARPAQLRAGGGRVSGVREEKGRGPGAGCSRAPPPTPFPSLQVYKICMFGSLDACLPFLVRCAQENGDALSSAGAQARAAAREVVRRWRLGVANG